MLYHIFIISKVSPLSFIYFDRLCNMWDVAHNSAHENIKRAFTGVSDVHSHSTRSSLNDDFFTKHSRLEKMLNSFIRIGPKVWNSLPLDMKKLTKIYLPKESKRYAL